MLNDFCSKYVSNTLGGSSNQSHIITENKEKEYTGRVFYKIAVGGEYNYAFLFSTNTDSNFAGQGSYPNMQILGWEILSAKVGLVDNCSMENCPEVKELKTLTFSGKNNFKAEKAGFFASDEIKLNAPKGQFLCLEITYKGEKIPHHYENTIPCFVLENGEWQPSNKAVFANMVGCDRVVKKKVAFFGDSITQGIGVENNSYNNWCALTAEKLGEDYAFWNLGIGCARVRDASLDGGWLAKAKQCDVVIYCLGVNDLYGGRTEREIKNDLDYSIYRLTIAGVKIIIQTIPPFNYEGDKLVMWQELNRYIKEELVKQVEMVLDIAPLIEKEGKAGQSKYGAHPNEKGNRKWANYIAPFLRKYLKTKRDYVEVLYDFGKIDGEIKPMHAVNNGPLNARDNSGTYRYFKEAKIPYARLHDASFNTAYGGEYSVDVHRVFPNFDADVNDEKSYLFGPTDKYLANIDAVGTKIFYRLGASIEHGYKKGTYPPKDYHKWAEICEHIIMHYTEGWANGFNYDIEYWEIWNEPDLYKEETGSPTWQGTQEEFMKFYTVTSKYLKSKFPHLKIGGPATCAGYNNFHENFFKNSRDNGAPVDFYSFHTYGAEVYGFTSYVKGVQRLMQEYGLGDAELILDEWNYVKGWHGEIWDYSIRSILGLKGSSFFTAGICIGQNVGLDMMMYYDARPCAMNGLFSAYVYEPLKTYFALKAFSHLYDLKGYISPIVKGLDVYTVGAKNDTEGAILITHYTDDDNAKNRKIKVKVDNGDNYKKAQIYAINNKSDLQLKEEISLTEKDFELKLNMKVHETYLIKLVK